MLVSESERLRDEIIAMADKFGRERSSLMPMLQEVQAKYACVSSDAMQMIADQLGIHPVEVYSVVTFYAFLNEHPKGKYVIRMSPPIEFMTKGSREEDVIENTAVYNRHLEKAIREFPEGWLWGHRRFKTQPDGSDPYAMGSGKSKWRG